MRPPHRDYEQFLAGVREAYFVGLDNGRIGGDEREAQRQAVLYARSSVWAAYPEAPEMERAAVLELIALVAEGSVVHNWNARLEARREAVRAKAEEKLEELVRKADREHEQKQKERLEDERFERELDRAERDLKEGHYTFRENEPGDRERFETYAKLFGVCEAEEALVIEDDPAQHDVAAELVARKEELQAALEEGREPESEWHFTETVRDKWDRELKMILEREAVRKPEQAKKRHDFEFER